MQTSNDIGLRIWAGFNGTDYNEQIDWLINEIGVGGFVLFRRNIESLKQLKYLTSEIKKHYIDRHGRTPFIAVDQEGGTVRRLRFLGTPSAYDMACGGEISVSAASSETAKTLCTYGINVNLAPVLDRVSDVKKHFLSTRSFGGDSKKVGRFGALWISLHQKHGVQCVAKHFPGLGQASKDPHNDALQILWNSLDDMWEDIAPFVEAVRAGVWGMMVSHACYPMLDPYYPALMSTVVCRDWLRERLGFQGLIISDDLDMKAITEHVPIDEVARRTLLAGVDCLLICNSTDRAAEIYEVLKDFVSQDKEACRRHGESITRIEKAMRCIDVKSR